MAGFALGDIVFPKSFRTRGPFGQRMAVDFLGRIYVGILAKTLVVVAVVIKTYRIC
jgi:hypothetical protein